MAEEKHPGYYSITPYEATADEAFALLNADGCYMEHQTVKDDPKIKDSLEVMKIYNCSGTKLKLYFNRTEYYGPYFVTFMTYTH
jgi:hypothetical protein